MSSEVTKDGLVNVRPDREAMVGAPKPQRPRSSRRNPAGSVVPEADFHSYYGLPVLNKPTWKSLDIAGYLFLGGLAGSSSALAGAAQLTGRPGLARRLKFGAAGAIGLSLAALVHDLGRPSRFYNMLRVFKPSSPMSMGTWILSVYGPATFVSAGLEILGTALPAPLRWVVSSTAAGRISNVATLVAAGTGPAVTTYTAALVSDTAVPAWHGGYREMPFVFAGSACSAGSGFGLMTAPLDQSGPARRLGAVSGLVELVMGRLMRSRMGLAAETYEQGRAGTLMKAAEAATAAGVVGAVIGRRSRLLSALSGACLVAGSALTRFGIFHAGVQSAEDPKYTVKPQRERLEGRAG